jgi:hypothetical protein
MWTNRIRWLTGLATLATAWMTAVALGDGFYMNYDGDQFPEDEGWQRRYSDPDGQTVRELDNGIFRLDTRASLSIYDLYVIQTDALNPQPGESLQIGWRMRTIFTQTDYLHSDVMLFLTNADSAYVEFYLGPDYVSEHDLGGGEFEHVCQHGPPADFTSFLFATNMQDYSLFVDGNLAFIGQFHDYAWSGPFYLAFGDGVIGRSSLSEWDYVEVQVVPEPSSGLLLCLIPLVRRASR